MTTPHRPQPSAAAHARSGWMKRLMPGRVSSATPSSSPSESTSHFSFESTSAGAATDRATTWLDSLLLVARLGVDFVEASESTPPAAKAVFESVVLLLGNVEKLHKNQEALKDLCEKIVSTLEMLQHMIQEQPGVASTTQLQKKCLDFQQLLNGISSRIEEIKKKQNSRRQRVKEFILPSGVTSAITIYERSIIDLQEQLKLIVVHDTVLNKNPGSPQLSAVHATTGMSWFEATFDPQLSRSQVEDALAESIGDVIQKIWNNLTNPIRATLNHIHNALEKVQALFNHLDAQFGNLVLIRSFQEAVLRWGRIDHMINQHLQNTVESQTSDSLAGTLAPGHTIIQQRFIRDKIQLIRNCPPPSQFFQGRKDILLQLDRFFQSMEQKEQKVVLLYGLGGAGKTQIALKFVSDSGSRFTDQFKINASSEEAIEMGYKQISSAKSLGDTAEAAQTWLKANHDEWLLLFDNADKVDLDLGAYLPKCAHGNILITSRNPQLWSHTGPDKKIIEISNLVVDDAVALLLKCAGLEMDIGNHKTHAVVVELYCFPLAIIQAGAFISKTPHLYQDISKFIPIYRENRAALLTKKPQQSQGDYEWTVYTTWEMSFKQLKPVAAQFLQLCSFIHFEGITEDIFKRASEYTPGHGLLDPSLNILQPGLDLLSKFVNAESKWSSMAFADMMSDICGYSLMTWQNDAYSIHPLVHQW
ncbi:P-loop containing nucleoside triphosphate hydrolase protein, partial [Mycena amicta]